jgi:hypothetical protein
VKSFLIDYRIQLRHLYHTIPSTILVYIQLDIYIDQDPNDAFGLANKPDTRLIA